MYLYDLKNITGSNYKQKLACQGGTGLFLSESCGLSFQAIRIFINQEMQELAEVLEIAPNCLKAGGKLVIITFQGLEDILVKQAIKKLTHQEQNNKFKSANLQRAAFVKLSKIKPGRAEILTNPRARSAKLRGIVKL